MSADNSGTKTLPIGKAGTAERARYTASFDRQYHPPETGIHIVGFAEDLPHGPHVSLVAASMPAAAAMALFARAKALHAVSDDDGDVLVDLVIESSTEDDFWMRRQMVEVLERELQNVR